jgi:hypothetical protein
MDPEEEARLERAAELREQIEKLQSGEEPDEEAETPREFVHRKMREEAEAAEDGCSDPSEGS